MLPDIVQFFSFDPQPSNVRTSFEISLVVFSPNCTFDRNLVDGNSVERFALIISYTLRQEKGERLSYLRIIPIVDARYPPDFSY